MCLTAGRSTGGFRALGALIAAGAKDHTRAAVLNSAEIGRAVEPRTTQHDVGGAARAAACKIVQTCLLQAAPEVAGGISAYTVNLVFSLPSVTPKSAKPGPIARVPAAL